MTKRIKRFIKELKGENPDRDKAIKALRWASRMSFLVIPVEAILYCDHTPRWQSFWLKNMETHIVLGTVMFAGIISYASVLLVRRKSRAGKATGIVATSTGLAVALYLSGRFTYIAWHVFDLARLVHSDFWIHFAAFCFFTAIALALVLIAAMGIRYIYRLNGIELRDEQA